MSDQDRGAYTPPTDDHLAFDARLQQRRRPAPMTLIVSIVGLVLLVGAVGVFYQSGVRGANEPPRVVGTPVDGIKSAPVEEAKPVDETAGLDVYVTDGPQAQPGAPTFAADPEQPQARPVEKVSPPPVATPAAAPLPVKVLTPEPAPAANAAGLRPAQAITPAAKAPPATTPLAKTPPAKVTAVKAAPAPAAKPEPVKAAAGGAAMVQIGAYTSTADADKEFAKVRSAFAKYTAGKAKRIEPTERNGKTLYRTAFTGFSKAEATAFCAALRSAGRDCMVK